MKVVKEYDEYDDQDKGKECEKGMGYVILCTSTQEENYIIVRGSRDLMGYGRRMLCLGGDGPIDYPIEDYVEEEDGPGILLESQDIYFSEAKLKGWYEENYGPYKQESVLKWLSSLHFSNIFVGPARWIKPEDRTPVGWPPQRTEKN